MRDRRLDPKLAWARQAISLGMKRASGKQRGILVPIKLDRIAPPLGFGEIQAIDLTNWKGKASDPFFQDLVAAVKAKIEGRPVPAAKGPIKRLQQRLTYGTAVSVLVAGIGAFGSNTFRLQDKVCASSELVSDLCGGFGLGGRPTKTERLAWQALRPGNCDDLRNFLGRFPSGAYGMQAHSLLADRHVTETPVWTAVTHQLVLRENSSEVAKGTLALAKADAVSRAQPKAVNLCNGFAAASRFRFKSARGRSTGVGVREKRQEVFLAGLMGRRSASWERRALGRRRAVGSRRRGCSERCGGTAAHGDSGAL